MSRFWAVVILGLSLVTGHVPAARAQERPAKFQCRLKDAQILPDRTQLRCTNSATSGLFEFAAETNQPYANRVAASAVQAMRSSGLLIVTYAPGYELNPRGCDVRTCRKIIDIDLVAVQAGAPGDLQRAQPEENPFADDAVDPFAADDVYQPNPARLAAPAPPATPVRRQQEFLMRPIPN